MILQTDYTRRFWTGLTTDDWGQADLQEGDVIYLMDVSECYVCGEGMMYQLPDLGGGGGSSPVLLASGTYTQTASASGVNIPVSYDGTKFSYFVYANISNVAHTHAWYRNDENVPWVTPDLTQLTSANYRDSANTNHLVSVMSNNNSIVYYSDPNIHINQFSNSYPVVAGDYTWKIWGYPS